MDHWKTYFDALQKSDWKKAAASLEAQRKLDPSDHKVHLRLGDVLQRAGDLPGAVVAYHKAAWCLMEKGFREKAIAIYKLILKIDPDDQEAINRSREVLMDMESQEPTHFMRIEVDNAEHGGKPEGFDPTGPEDGEKAISFEVPLGVSSFVSSIGEQEFSKLEDRGALRSFVHGSTVIREGEHGDSIFVIRKGAARVTAILMGRQVELASLYEGDVFGEVAFLTGRPRTATVTAEGTLEALEIDRQTLEEAIGRNPRILNTLEDFYSSRVQDTIRKARDSG